MTAHATSRRIKAAGVKKVLTMCDILNEPVKGSGYNPEFGLLGSNKANEETVKLFPKNAQEIAEAIQAEILSRTGVKIEAMIYGDGAFKDPICRIWELADPVVSPGFTAGLHGMPNELKIKYLADNEFAGLSGNALKKAIQGQYKGEGTATSKAT